MKEHCVSRKESLQVNVWKEYGREWPDNRGL